MVAQSWNIGGTRLHKRYGMVVGTIVGLSMLAGCGSPGAQPTSSPATVSPSGSTAAPPATSAKPATSGAAAASAKPAASTGAAGNTIAVSYSQATSGFAPLYMAKDLGLFEKNGLNVDIKRVSGAAQVPALVANEIQIAGVGGTEVTNLNMQGGSLVMVAVVDDFPTFSLYANKKYKAVPELAGESVGITTAGSSTDASARLFLKHYDMLDKVKIVPSGSTVPGILAAMSKGLAAGILSPPITAQADNEGYVELVNGFKLGEPLNTAGFTVTRSYLKDNAATVTKFLKGYAAGWSYVADTANKAVVVKSLEKYTETDEPTAAVGYDATLPVWQAKKVPTVDPQGLTNILALSTDPKATQAKAADSIDNSYLEAAVKA